MAVSAKKSILFLINPKSGVQNKVGLPKLIESVLDKQKYEYSIAKTEYRGHATELAEDAVKQQIDAVVAVGGDGTVNEVGRALVGSKTALGILPFGSGNGLARHLGIPINPRSAIEFINKALPVSVDYGKINDFPFFCTCGIGFDAFVSHSFSKGKRRGLFGYMNNTLMDFIKYESEVYEVETEWNRKKHKAFLIACGNAAQYGNNAYIAPKASMRDGMLSVTILEPFTVVDIPMILGQLFSRNLCQNNRIKTIDTRWIKIKRRERGVVHFDGEPVVMDANLFIEIVPSGLNVLASPDWDGSGANISIFQQGVDLLRGTLPEVDIQELKERLPKLTVKNIKKIGKQD